MQIIAYKHHRLLLFIGKSCRVLSSRRIEAEKPFKLSQVLVLRGDDRGLIPNGPATQIVN